MVVAGLVVVVAAVVVVVAAVVVVARVVGGWVSGTVARVVVVASVVVVALVVVGAVVTGWVVVGCVAGGCGAGAGLGVGTATTPLTDVAAETLVVACDGALVVAEAVVAVCARGCSVVTENRLTVVAVSVVGALAPVAPMVVVLLPAATHTNEFFTLVQRSTTPFTVAVLLTALAAQREPARAGAAFADFGFVAALAELMLRAVKPVAIRAAIVVVVAMRRGPVANRRVMGCSLMRSHHRLLRLPRPGLRILRLLSGTRGVDEKGYSPSYFSPW